MPTAPMPLLPTKAPRSYDKQRQAVLAHNPRTETSCRPKAESPLTLHDISEFLNLSEDEQYARTVSQWRALALKLGHEGLRTALNGTKLDKNKLAGILTAAGISHDKAWSKRENTAVLVAIPASIHAAIVKSLGLGSTIQAPMVLPSPPLDTPIYSASLITDVLVTPDTHIGDSSNE